MTTILHLTKDCWSYILDFLFFCNALSLRKCCTTFNKLISREEIWNRWKEMSYDPYSKIPHDPTFIQDLGYRKNQSVFFDEELKREVPIHAKWTVSKSSQNDERYTITNLANLYKLIFTKTSTFVTSSDKSKVTYKGISWEHRYARFFYIGPEICIFGYNKPNPIGLHYPIYFVFPHSKEPLLLGHFHRSNVKVLKVNKKFYLIGAKRYNTSQFWMYEKGVIEIFRMHLDRVKETIKLTHHFKPDSTKKSFTLRSGILFTVHKLSIFAVNIETKKETEFKELYIRNANYDTFYQKVWIENQPNAIILRGKARKYLRIGTLNIDLRLPVVKIPKT